VVCACRDGNFVRELSYLPLALDIPVAFNSCRKGPRGLEWRSDKPAELAWMEAQVHMYIKSGPPHMGCGTWSRSTLHSFSAQRHRDSPVGACCGG
jgi:hypothetical protein